MKVKDLVTIAILTSVSVGTVSCGKDEKKTEVVDPYDKFAHYAQDQINTFKNTVNDPKEYSELLSEKIGGEFDVIDEKLQISLEDRSLGSKNPFLSVIDKESSRKLLDSERTYLKGNIWKPTVCEDITSSLEAFYWMGKTKSNIALLQLAESVAKDSPNQSKTDKESVIYDEKEDSSTTRYIGSADKSNVLAAINFEELSNEGENFKYFVSTRVLKDSVSPIWENRAATKLVTDEGTKAYQDTFNLKFLENGDVASYKQKRFLKQDLKDQKASLEAETDFEVSFVSPTKIIVDVKDVSLFRGSEKKQIFTKKYTLNNLGNNCTFTTE